MEDTWNNVELTNISRRKSYTLNHNYDAIKNHKGTNGNGNGTNTASAFDGDGNIRKEGKQNNGLAVLQPGSNIKPKVTEEDVECLVRRLYGITIGEMQELISYDDRNYFIKEDPNIKNPFILLHCQYGYVLKILNSLDSKKQEIVDGQNQLMLYLTSKHIRCPRPVTNTSGTYYSLESINGEYYIVRLLEYVPGKLLHEVEMTNYLLFQSGEYLAKLVNVLKSFKHEAYDEHRSTWQLQSTPKLRDFLCALNNEARQLLVEEIIEKFETIVLSQLSSFAMQIIHGDYNEQNIIVEMAENGKDHQVAGVIDFGDTNKSPVLFEVAIAMTYMMLQAKNLMSGGIFLAGFESVLPLTLDEKLYLKYCVAARLAQSLVMGAYTHSINPANEYVLVTQAQGWKLIDELWSERFTEIDSIWKMAGDEYAMKQSLH